MKLIIVDEANDVADWAARYIKRKILDFKPSADRHFVLGLPTGVHGCGSWLWTGYKHSAIQML